MYACTHICKEVEKDDYETGCHGGRKCVMSERVNIVAETMPELLAKIGNQYGLKIDDVWIADNTDTAIGRIGFNRLETDDGSEPSRREESRWRAGRMQLWLADYDMFIERRECRPLTIEEFSGVTFHR